MKPNNVKRTLHILGAEKYADKALSPAKKRGFLFVGLGLNIGNNIKGGYYDTERISFEWI